MTRVLSTFLLLISFSVFGADPAPPAAALVEQRMAKLSEELRCLVCQNQSLADSQSGLADDLRREIRSMVVDGKNDKEIVDFLVQRYGDFVRYRPAVKASTLLLWFGPFALLAVAGLAFYIRLRRRLRTIADTPLTDDERMHLQAVLEGGKGENA